MSSVLYSFPIFFFFSSRRRHTRCSRDWSSACALPISSCRSRAAIPVSACSNIPCGHTGDSESDLRRLCSSKDRRRKRRNGLLHWAQNRFAARTKVLVSILPEDARPENCDRRPGYARHLHPLQAEAPKLDEASRKNKVRRNDSQLCRNMLRIERTDRLQDAIGKHVPECVSDLQGSVTVSREALTFL